MRTDVPGGRRACPAGSRSTMAMTSRDTIRAPASHPWIRTSALCSTSRVSRRGYDVEGFVAVHGAESDAQGGGRGRGTVRVGP
ncbi:hypothetical protein NS229_16715, partial [Methylobacterium indicum]